MTLDRHGQPALAGYNRNRNIEKAISGLHGILQGITADHRLGEREMLFLDVWLRSQEHIKDDGDLIDILDLIGDIMRDGVVTHDELEDLRSMLSDILEYREMPYINEESKVNELLGLISGIAADGVLADEEIQFLADWLEHNADVTDVWPISVIERRLTEALRDGVIDQVERADLLETIQQITGDRFEDTSIAFGMATDFLEDQLITIEHEDKCFCFTGKFVTGARKTVEHTAQRRGAITTSNVSKKLDYLVIGTLASRDWRFSSHGRKIEEALKLRETGAPIVITTERTWLTYLSD